VGIGRNLATDLTACMERDDLAAIRIAKLVREALHQGLPIAGRQGWGHGERSLCATDLPEVEPEVRDCQQCEHDYRHRETD
jgi:hypothetical protein